VEQTQLDEEFARQLMPEDEQQYAREQIARRQQEQQQQQQFPYAQRTNAPIPHQQQQGDRGHGTGTYDSDDDGQHSPQRDTMTDMQEQFSKLAESMFHVSLRFAYISVAPPRCYRGSSDLHQLVASGIPSLLAHHLP
jgi:hypothetical protein